MQTSHAQKNLNVAIALLALTLTGCSSVTSVIKPSDTPIPTAKPTISTSTLPPAGSGRGGYYLDDGPGDKIPGGLEKTPDAAPRVEPFSPRANRPYSVFGTTYTPVTDNRSFTQRGVGSWYGKKFHGKKTSSGELYDMYKMTAAHPTLPIPSYSRVTNLDNGKQIIVRINDRGPFRSSRIIDLSYTAALKLGYLGKGSGMLQVEHLRPEEIERITQSARNKRNRKRRRATGAAAAGQRQPVSATAVRSRKWRQKQRNAANAVADWLLPAIGCLCAGTQRKHDACAICHHLGRQAAASAGGAKRRIVPNLCGPLPQPQPGSRRSPTDAEFGRVQAVDCRTLGRILIDASACDRCRQQESIVEIVAKQRLPVNIRPDDGGLKWVG